ncbi:MAG: serine/threonine-protein kinase [Planctomycetota bacterium]|nr:serine/threonine-protein kinase [Planctomycetota bacterium]
MTEHKDTDSILQDFLKQPRMQRYEIGEEVSRGGHGVVYRARNIEKNINVALKVMIPEKDPVEQQRFREDALVLSQLSHPNLVQISDYGIEKGVFFLAFEEVNGKTLAEIARSVSESGRNAAYFDEVKSYISEIAKAVRICHKKGILHQSISPDSIVIESGSNRPVLVDFTLVGTPSIKAPDLTTFLEGLRNQGFTTVIPAYMSPEQVDPQGKHGKLGVHTDIWALGATLYFALTGTIPHSDKGSGLELLESRLNSEPTPAQELDSSIPQNLSNVCQMGLCRDSLQRPNLEVFVRRLGQEHQGEFKRFKAEGERVTRSNKWLVWVILVIVGLSLTYYFTGADNEASIDGRALSVWTVELQSDNGKLSEAAATAFIGEPEISIPHLVQLVRGKDADLSSRALIVLGRMGVVAKPALPELRIFLKEKDGNEFLKQKIERAMRSIMGELKKDDSDDETDDYEDSATEDDE